MSTEHALGFALTLSVGNTRIWAERKTLQRTNQHTANYHVKCCVAKKVMAKSKRMTWVSGHPNHYLSPSLRITSFQTKNWFCFAMLLVEASTLASCCSRLNGVLSCPGVPFLLWPYPLTLAVEDCAVVQRQVLPVWMRPVQQHLASGAKYLTAYRIWSRSNSDLCFKFTANHSGVRHHFGDKESAQLNWEKSKPI